MSRIPDREEIVTEALKEINPSAEAACEKEIRIYLSLLDDLRALKEARLPSPAEIRDEMKRLGKAVEKVEAILQSPACVPFRRMPAYLDYDRLMADLKKVRQTADYQVKHYETQHHTKTFGLVKWWAGKYAVSLIDKFGTERPSKARLGSILFRGATGIRDDKDSFEDVIAAVNKADLEEVSRARKKVTVSNDTVAKADLEEP
jgi:hypothetical protein